jgi:hypothetical protein
MILCGPLSIQGLAVRFFARQLSVTRLHKIGGER